MNKYESVLILKPGKEEELEKQVMEIEDYMHEIGCKNITTDNIGIKTLAYMVKGNEKGYYARIYFNAETRTSNIYEHYLAKENQNVIKFIVIRDYTEEKQMIIKRIIKHFQIKRMKKKRELEKMRIIAIANDFYNS